MLRVTIASVPADDGPPGDLAVDSADGPLALPRSQVGSPPQHLLTTLLGDYWYRPTEHLPSGALVRLAEEFGVTAIGARAALSRLSRRGTLETSKVGRHTFYGLTPIARHALGVGARRIVSFGQSEKPWDGRWTIVAFSLPENQRDVRHTLRGRLRWLGYAALYDGMWISARADCEQTLSQLRELGVSTATVLRVDEPTEVEQLRSPIEAWDLDGLRARYDEFIARHAPVLSAARAGTIGPREALMARTQVMENYAAFGGRDPDLPGRLLPPDWPGGHAREIFGEIYDALGPLAEMRVRQVVSAFDVSLASKVRHHTIHAIAVSGT